MRRLSPWLLVVFSCYPPSARAQTAPVAQGDVPPIWDVQVGASFVGTSGNSDTSSAGADLLLHRRWPIWQIESTASAIRTSGTGTETAERYMAGLRAQRPLTSVVGVSVGERVEHDPRAGMSVRSVLDAGLSWALVRRPTWTLDGITALAWVGERPVVGPSHDGPAGVLQIVSRVPFGATGDTIQRVTVYPDFKTTSAYRSEAEVTAHAAMNRRLALKLGYLLRYSHAPVLTFKRTDTTVTASVVVGWKSATPAPAR